MKFALQILVLIAWISSTVAYSMTEVPEDRGPHHQPARDEYISNSYSDSGVIKDPMFKLELEKLQKKFELAARLADLERLLIGYQSYLKIHFEFMSKEEPSKVLEYYRKNTKSSIPNGTAAQDKVYVDTILSPTCKNELNGIPTLLWLLDYDDLEETAKADTIYFRFTNKGFLDSTSRMMEEEIADFLKPFLSKDYDKYEALLRRLLIEKIPQPKDQNETQIIIFLKSHFVKLPGQIQELKVLKAELRSQPPEEDELAQYLVKTFDLLYSGKFYKMKQPDNRILPDYFNYIFREWFEILNQVSRGTNILVKRWKVLHSREKQRAESIRISQARRKTELGAHPTDRSDEKPPEGQVDLAVPPQEVELEIDDLRFLKALQEHNTKIFGFREDQFKKVEEYKRGVEASRAERRGGARSADVNRALGSEAADSKSDLAGSLVNPLSETEKKALRSIWSLASGGAKDLFIRIFREREKGFSVDQLDNLVSSMGKFNRKTKSSHFKILLPNTYALEGLDDSTVGFVTDEREAGKAQSSAAAVAAKPVKGGTSRLHGGAHTENRISGRNFDLLLDVYQRAGITVERLRLAGINI